MAFDEVASVKLFGDWLLRIKFTYTIKNYKGNPNKTFKATKILTDLPSQI
jgi:hypothetical protein